MGRRIAELLADFGHDLPTRPDTPTPTHTRSPFTAVPSWRGRRWPGAGWAASRPPVRRYRMTSDQAGLYWPFTAPAATAPTGAPMGTDVSSGATFYVDPHGWVQDDQVPVTNPNIFIFGKPGRGKSAWVKAFLNRMFAFGYRALILGDPKDEYEALCHHFDVEPFRIGPGMSARLNPLDPGPLAAGWDRMDRLERESRSRIIFGRWLVLLRGLIGSQTIGDQHVPVGPSEEQVLKAVLESLTRHASDSRQLRPITLPQIWAALNDPTPDLVTHTRFQDRQRFLDDTRLLRDATAQLTTGVLAGIFDSETTIRIDWTAPVQSLSLSRLADLGDQATGTALTCLSSWGAATRSTGAGGNRINVRDEAWKQLRLGPDAVAAFDADLRLSRAHGDIELAVSHKPSDYQSAGHTGSQTQEIAKDLLHLADIKVLYGQDAQVADDLEGLLDLGPVARDAVTGWAMNHKGRALVCVGPRTHKVQLALHPDLELPLTHTNQHLHAT
ncbi:ATP-binding protein [Tessaracoccus sp. OS52]|uniref:ATP-binding protein n=1 Tax=Tessaracoccus sp. OS52 TaxID=2886691 RepID=UPI001D11FD2F|nr:ATP-binding protein [Tessaracoccus sp. OS52]MCC2592542.1 ATP-binding protein [Tessaracoccus sp. OS52]